MGSILPLVAIGMTALALFLALALDTGRLYLARTQLQVAADNAARAALVAAYDPKETKPKDVRDAGKTAARRTVAGNTVIDGGARLDDKNVEYGNYNFDTSTFQVESSTDAGIGRPSAVRVRVLRTGESKSPIAGTLLPMNVAAEATASLRCREISVAVDLSFSFEDELKEAKDALGLMVDQMQSGDSLAMVSFNGAGTDDHSHPLGAPLPLTTLTPSARAAAKDWIENLQTCSGGGCIGTNTTEGIRAAREQLESAAPLCNGERVVFLVSDGVPCAYKGLNPDPEETEQRRRESLDQADLVAKANPKMSLSSIFIYDPSLGEQTCGGGGGFPIPLLGSIGGSKGKSADSQFMEALVRGNVGRFYQSDGKPIEELLTLAINSFPVVVVR